MRGDHGRCRVRVFDKGKNTISSPTTLIDIQVPCVNDAAAVDELIAVCPPLDRNSRYAYLLLCHHHAATCAVARMDDRIVGFVSAYRLPESPDTLFVWQVAVHGDARGQRLAGRMIDHILDRPSCEGVRFIDTTVSPSNIASRRVFEHLAEAHGAPLESSPLFTAEHFGAAEHEEEHLIRMGPITIQGA